MRQILDLKFYHLLKQQRSQEVVEGEVQGTLCSRQRASSGADVFTAWMETESVSTAYRGHPDMLPAEYDGPSGEGALHQAKSVQAFYTSHSHMYLVRVGVGPREGASLVIGQERSRRTSMS